MDERTDRVQAQPAHSGADIFTAVQSQLTSFGEQVATEIAKLAQQVAAESAARQQIDAQVRALAEAVQLLATNATPAGNGGPGPDAQHVNALAARMDRLVDDVHGGIGEVVQAAAHSATQDLVHRHESLAADVSQLDGSLRRFDEQAAKLVVHVNSVAADVQTRLEEFRSGSSHDVEARVAAVVARVDELAAGVTRQQGELAQLVTQRVNKSEDRVNDRMLASEQRMSDKFGGQVADIEAHVGRMGAGLDDSVALLADRIGGLDSQLAGVDAKFEEVAELVSGIDSEALDEIKEQIASASGEAMLVRIELERFQKTVGETQDRTDVRLTSVETAIQDQTLDVETAIQLERLEEVERAIIALDPAQFVLRSDPDNGNTDRGNSDNGNAVPTSAPSGAVGPGQTEPEVAAAEPAAPATAPLSPPSPVVAPSPLAPPAMQSAPNELVPPTLAAPADGDLA